MTFSLPTAVTTNVIQTKCLPVLMIYASGFDYMAENKKWIHSVDKKGGKECAMRLWVEHQSFKNNQMCLNSSVTRAREADLARLQIDPTKESLRV